MKLLLIDSNALFHRSRSALLRAAGEMTTSYGMPVTGTYGFLNALFSLMDKHNFDCVIPVYDKGGNWRKQESESYKANRSAPDLAHATDMSLLIREVLPELGFTPIGIGGYEADDVIGHICQNSPAYSEIFILTCDRDLFQLVNNKVKIILFNSAKKVEIIGEEEVVNHFGVGPEEVKFFKALAGDSSDNVQGIKGIGPKTAVKIINESKNSTVNPEWSLVDRIISHPEILKKSSERFSVFLNNLKLVTLETNIPDARWFASSPPKSSTVSSIFTQLEFRSFLKESRFKKICATLGATG